MHAQICRLELRARRHREPRDDRARRPGRGPRAGPRLARVLHQRRLRGGRDRAQDGPQVPPQPRRAGALQGDQPPRLLPRRDARVPRASAAAAPTPASSTGRCCPARSASRVRTSTARSSRDLECAHEIERAILNEGPETVAAVIGEPISAAAGVHTPNAFYWPTVRADLRPLRGAADLRRGDHRLRPHRHDVRLRALGRRAGHHHGRQGPDGRLRADRRRDRLARRSPRRSRASTPAFNHRFTFGGNPAACAAGLATLDIIEREGAGRERARDGRLPLRARAASSTGTRSSATSAAAAG